MKCHPSRSSDAILLKMIEVALREPLPAVSNEKVTAAHFALSEALQEVTGREAGPNFHSWAVWGSKKAGVTIRQEDLDDALKNATVVSGISGFMVGIITSAVVIWSFLDASVLLWLVLLSLGGIIGFAAGALVGRAIARYSRSEAARLILEGNRTVLEDIGSKTAEFVTCSRQANASAEFYESFKSGQTSAGGQNLLKEAFRAYEKAAKTENAEEKRRLCCFGNCLAILHEHIRLQPYIVRSLPFIIRRCVTQRMMTFDVGRISLSVAEEFSALDKDYKVVELSPEHKRQLIESMKRELPASKIDDRMLFDEAEKYAADNWTRIEQRMRYVWELFKRFHLEPEVRSKPF